jgi:hypothetical protein
MLCRRQTLVIQSRPGANTRVVYGTLTEYLKGSVAHFNVDENKGKWNNNVS